MCQLESEYLSFPITAAAAGEQAPSSPPLVVTRDACRRGIKEDDEEEDGQGKGSTSLQALQRLMDRLEEVQSQATTEFASNPHHFVVHEQKLDDIEKRLSQIGRLIVDPQTTSRENHDWPAES